LEAFFIIEEEGRKILHTLLEHYQISAHNCLVVINNISRIINQTVISI